MEGYMLEFPPTVFDYIYSQTIESRSPAYLLVAKDGRLADWGGKLEAYGITGLQKGEYALEQVCFLKGLLPLDGTPLFLPCVQVESSLPADIHIFPGDEGDWVLLLDATAEEIQRRQFQQKACELSLKQRIAQRI